MAADCSRLGHPGQRLSDVLSRLAELGSAVYLARNWHGRLFLLFGEAQQGAGAARCGRRRLIDGKKAATQNGLPCGRPFCIWRNGESFYAVAVAPNSSKARTGSPA